MKTTQITRLFAVVAMAASPAVANPPAQPDRWAVSAEKSSRAVGIMISIGFAALARSREVPPAESLVVATPRTTPSGAPACGNVASRAPRPRECAVPGPAMIADVPAPAPTTAAMPIAANLTGRGAK